IDCKVEVMIAGLAGKLQQLRRELLEDARARDRLEARMQRRELDRDAGPVRKGIVAGRGPDRRDGGRVGVEIARRVGAGAGAFAQHVEGIAVALLLAGPPQRLLDRLPKDEM